MEHLQKAWNNFTAQPEIWFFYGFLLTSMLSIRKVLVDYPLAGAFNEYSGVYVYLSDLFFIMTLVSWLISILYNKDIRLSIYSRFNVSPQKECSTGNILRGRRRTFYILGIFLAWTLLTISWAERPEIGYFKFFKLFEFGLLFLFLILNEKCSTPEGMFHGEHPTGQAWNILKNIFGILIFIGFINALIGILQVALQHSIGLFWLKEGLISPDLPGVAKIVLGGSKYIRAYGLFPHPNILGGFLVLSIILTFAYKNLFHPSTNVPYGTSYGAGVEQAPGGTMLWRLLFSVQIIGLALTFSKSAILGLILAFFYLGYKRELFPVEHYKNLKEFVKSKKWLILGIFLALLAIALIILPDSKQFLLKSLAERLLYLEAAKNIIQTNMLFGIGAGQFVLEMPRYLPGLLDWQFQPVHNVFLLIWSELGLIGLVIFGWLIYKLFQTDKNVPCGTIDSWNNLNGLFKAILVGFLFISLFDHYFWDIQQGQIMLWLTLGMLLGNKFNT